jgi:GST-like protein
MLKLNATCSPDGWRLAAAAEELSLRYFVETRGEPASNGPKRARTSLATSGRDPILVDHGNDEFPVFAANAALLYLGERHGRLLGREPRARACALQWLCWESAALGPLEDFGRGSFPSNGRPAIPRPTLAASLTLLDRRLGASAFLAGAFGIADLAVWRWVHHYVASGVDLTPVPSLCAWYGTLSERLPLRRALAAFRRKEPREVDPLAITAAQ